MPTFSKLMLTLNRKTIVKTKATIQIKLIAKDLTREVPEFYKMVKMDLVNSHLKEIVKINSLPKEIQVNSHPKLIKANSLLKEIQVNSHPKVIQVNSHYLVGLIKVIRVKVDKVK